MNYEEFLPIYPEIDSSSLQQDILNKKEFFDLKLTKEIESIAEGDFLNHQKIIQRFMNSHTLYDELLLYHETGTGKSGVAFGVTENLFESKSFSQVLVFARGNAHLVMLLKQLVYKFSTRYSIPENIEEDKKIRYMRKKVSDFYRFHTFETFANRLRGLTDEDLRNRYSNHVFIVDEVHQFKSDSDANIYKQFHRLFHVTTNRKILLMSGTPMRDDVSEIAYVMNLILPLEQQLPNDRSFRETFVDENNIINQDDLKSRLRGRISYLSSSPVDTRSRYMGQYLTPLQVEQFKVYPTVMKNPQIKGYAHAYELDTTKEGSIYSRSRQASLFVFPDESYGKEGMDKYLTSSGDLIPELASELGDLERLAKYSSKYAFIIQNILDYPTKLVYIYCSAVSGGGIQMLSKILKLYNFRPASGTERRPGRRFIALSSEVADIDTPLSFFNQRRNRYGDYCQVIIGSRKMSESFTFKNIQIVHITTLHWNYTEIQQATARAIRFGSHNDLINDGVLPVVEIYQHASVLPRERQNVVSLDALMLKTSQDKDILIRKMDRVIKEISFDCPLNFERNARTTGTGTRDCDYQDCDYKCDDSRLDQTIEDLSTYRLYYQNEDQIYKNIRMVFSKHFALQFESIQDILQIDQISLMKALSDHVRLNIPLVNAYGIECYLREEDNRFYLVDNIALPNKHQELGVYTQHPIVSHRSSLKQIVQKHLFMHNLQQLDALKAAKTLEEAKTHLENLSLVIQEQILEEAMEQKYIQRSSHPLIPILEKVYNANLSVRKGVLYSDLLQPRIRCLVAEEKEWKDCALPSPEKEKEFEVKVDVEQNPYGYYGIIEDDRFCIRDIRNAIKPTRGKIDKRKIKTGSNCLEVGFNKPKLAEICIHLGIEVPSNELHPDPRAELNRSNAGKRLLEDWGRWPDDRLAQGYYWYNKTKKEVCGVLKEWFAAHGLLVQEKCGQAGKIKEKENLRTVKG